VKNLKIKVFNIVVVMKVFAKLTISKDLILKLIVQLKLLIRIMSSSAIGKMKIAQKCWRLKD